MQSHKNCNTVSRYSPLAILASRPLNNKKFRSRSQLKFPLPAPVFSSHPEYRHKISQIPYPTNPIVDPHISYGSIQENLFKRQDISLMMNYHGFLVKMC